MIIPFLTRSTLQELLESQPGGRASGKTAQGWLPTPPAQTHLPTPPPTQQTCVDPVDHKRKRNDKGKEVIETGRTRSSQEDDLQRVGSKYPRGMQTRSAHEADKRSKHQVMASTWDLAMELNGAPLTSGASIRDFQDGMAGYIAHAVEQSLLLPKGMTDLRFMRQHEVFLGLKRDLAMVIVLI